LIEAPKKFVGHSTTAASQLRWRLGFGDAKVRPANNPPPVAGLNTRTSAVSDCAMSLPEISAVNCVTQTKVVGQSGGQLREFLHRAVKALTDLADRDIRDSLAN